MQGAGMFRPTLSARLLLAVLLPPLFGGCTLIDQRTFNPRAGLPPEKPPLPGPPPPLITMDFERPGLVYEPQLREAVDQALSRKPTADFDVVTVVPALGTPQQQADAGSSIRGDAREVGHIINDQGVDLERVHLLARSEAGVTGRQVQVFVH